MNENKVLGFKIRQARLSRGMTMGYVSSTLGLSKQTLSSMETGKRKISAMELLRLCDTIGTRIRFTYDEMAMLYGRSD